MRQSPTVRKHERLRKRERVEGSLMAELVLVVLPAVILGVLSYPLLAASACLGALVVAAGRRVQTLRAEGREDPSSSVAVAGSSPVTAD